ncbi:hypothetical protein [Ulvibacterium sp.]|uniref:hypothetical protein n=1 Tax=Ulvibacterium sp. TaxID=2665914 RepID=UPI0026311227|nr:hypothetical protein [Ulvibacterium sp.]
MSGQRYEECRHPDAKPGNPGTNITTAPLTAGNGLDGNINQIEYVNSDETYNKISKNFSLIYYEIALRAIEVDYVNGKIEEALDGLNWLGKLLFNYNSISTNRESVLDFGDSNEVINQQEINAIRSRVFMLIRRIALNLDYYGNSPTHVPLVAYQFYSNVLDEFLEHAKNIESSYIKFRDAEDKLSVEIKDIRDNVDSQLDFISSMERGLNHMNESEIQLVSDLEFLTNQYEGKWYAVQQASEAFKNAVRAEANNCSFGDVLKTAATIAVSIKTMGAGWALAAEAYKTYNGFDAKKDSNDKLGDLAEPVYKVKKIAKVGEGVSNIAKGLTQIVDVLDSDNPDVNLPSDAGKLLTKREELEKTIEPFRHLPEAKEYLAAVDDFIELVTTRNSKILEYNELNSLRSDISFEIEKQESEIGRLRLLLNNANAQSLPEFANFMGRSNLANKKSIIQLLYSEHKAMEYFTAQRSEFKINRDSVAHLSQVHANTKRRIVAEMENRGRNPQVIKFSDKIAHFSLLKDYREEELKTFREKGEVFFFLSDLRYENMALVKFNKVVISLPGLKLRHRRRGDDFIGANLSHLGYARIRTREGNFMEFNHDTRKTFIVINPKNGNSVRPVSLGGDGANFIQLTPFGPWSLSIAREDVDRVDLSSVEDIQLNFEGEFFSI